MQLTFAMIDNNLNNHLSIFYLFTNNDNPKHQQRVLETSQLNSH